MAKKNSNDVMSKQKAIETVRAAARRAKTRLNDAKRKVQWAEEGVKYASERTVGTTEWDNAAAIARHVAEQKARVASAKLEVIMAEAGMEEAKANLAEVEATVVEVKTQFDHVLRWYSGTSLTNAKAALELLDASIKNGFWMPGASRKVRAALGKCNVAKKQIKTTRSSESRVETDLYSAVQYGVFYPSFTKHTAKELRTVPLAGEGFMTDMQPVISEMFRLDNTRPAAVFTLMNASPLVSSHLKTLNVTKVEVCPLERQVEETVDAKGNVSWRYVYVLLWPAGIKHLTSKFAYGTNNNAQCHACGHAIKNGYNWVPMVLTMKNGDICSYWVGRDCAETLFGVKLEGELEISGAVDGR